LGYPPTIISQKIKNLKKVKVINNDTISKRKFNMAYLRKEKIPKIDNQIIKLLKQGKTITEISKTLGLTIALIFKRIRILQKIGILTQDIIEQNPDLAYLKKNKVTINDDSISEQKNKTYLRKKTLSKIDNQIIELLKQGKTIAEIADELFYSKFTISKKIRNLKISGILDSKEKHSNNKTDKTPLSKHIQNMQKAKSIYYLNSKYGHNFFSKAFRQARAINDLGKLTPEDVDILAKALLIEPPTLENVINISRLYIDTKQYQKCIIFLEQAREFFNEEQKSKINELLLEIKTTIKNNQKNEIAVAK
jgi:DNA-binding NarL/FixJ family response regulator